MEAKTEKEITDEDLKKAFTNTEKVTHEDKKTKKAWLVFLIIGIVGFVGGLTCFLLTFLKPIKKASELVYPAIPSKTVSEAIYSELTGEALADTGLKNAPIYCIQIPNGLDGARPQAGLTDAGVIFEAIAEAGITRFAAFFQKPSSAVIGPIRSLRIYYLNWDTPFDCTIVHAGGADDAIAALRSGGYKELDENYYYMFRGTSSSRLWNNLFTTSGDLERFSQDSGYGSSEARGFSRLTPEEAKKNRVQEIAKEKLVITEATVEDTSELIPKAQDINFRFGGVPAFNVSYHYDAANNNYLRSYSNGVAHEVYRCPNENLGQVNPEETCSLTQLAPSVVIAMIVQERRAADNYHEDITATGTGEAFVFQNGVAIKGTWNKASASEQIKFLDENGSEIKLIPGQTIVSAIPTYGGVEY